MKKTAIVYWLFPAKPERDLFCEIVRILRKELRAPNFEPHLTLLVSSKNGRSSKEVLRQIRSRPIRLSVRGVAFSPKFTKTLFVRFTPNSALKKLAIDLRRAATSSAKAAAGSACEFDLQTNFPASEERARRRNQTSIPNRAFRLHRGGSTNIANPDRSRR